MAASFLRNGSKAHLYVNSIWRRKTISNTIGAPITRPHFHQPKASYSRFPQRKPKEVEFTVPIASTCTKDVASISKTGFIGWYLGMTKTRPILTKSVTCAVIYTAADLSSQTITRSSSDSYDFIRTLRMGGYGMLLLGPALHFWFTFMSKTLPKRDLISTFKKMFLGQAIFAPIMMAVFFSVNASLKGESGTEIVARLKRDLIPVLARGAMFWPLCDFITFRFIPLHLQSLVSNSFAYIWTIYTTYMASLEKASTK